MSVAEFEKDYRYSEDYVATVPASSPDTFQGIVRPDGRVATRNYIGILTSVNCSATVARAIADHFRRDRSEEHTSELQSLMRNSYAVFCLKKTTHLKNNSDINTNEHTQNQQ